MRVKTLIAGVTIVTIGMITPGAQVSAEASDLVNDDSDIKSWDVREYIGRENNSLLTALLTEDELNRMEANLQETDSVVEEEDEDEEPIVHEVQRGESLVKIADEYDITWTRIWDKNDQLDHPDVLHIGEELEIPFEDEELNERELPEVVVVEPEIAEAAPEPARTEASATQPAASSNSSATTSAPAATQQQTAPRGSNGGNLYTAGNCTWYAKNRRPDLPNNLGNADTWAARAAAQGIPTGSEPRVGAIGQQGMHVVYVEAVHGDGTVTISEMNWKGLYVISQRTVAASNFRYIY